MGNKPGLTTTLQRAAILFLPGLLLLLIFDASSGSPAQSQNQTSVEAGRRVFLGSCSMTYCHGNEGIGGGAPKLRDREYSAEFLRLVIAEGIPGTSMPAFKNQYSKEQIANVAAYVLTLSPGSRANAKSSQPQQTDQHIASATPKPEAAPKLETSHVITNDTSDLRGDAAAGRELFFDSTQIQNCRVCHTAQGVGGKIGPDLSNLAGKSPREILQGIVTPHAAINEKYAAITITTRSGEKFTGVKRDEDETTIRLYDTSSLPPVSRAFLKSEVAKAEKLNTSAMPADYASKYSLKQLLDLVSFLKSSNVSLKELF